MSVLRTIWQGLDWSVLTDMLMRVLPALLCITLHELGHGYTALWLGDTTARDMGRLSLNPLRHLDPMGLVMMVVFRFGWAKPVPINMYRFKDPKRGMALTALSGPVTSFLLSLAMLFLYGLCLPLGGSRAGTFLLTLFASSAVLSLSLSLFNLLPIPPLDGSKVLFSLLSDQAYGKLMRYERYGMLLLMALLSTGLIREPLSDAAAWLFDKLLPVAEAGLRLTAHFL